MSPQRPSSALLLRTPEAWHQGSDIITGSPGVPPRWLGSCALLSSDLVYAVAAAGNARVAAGMSNGAIQVQQPLAPVPVLSSRSDSQSAPRSSDFVYAAAAKGNGRIAADMSSGGMHVAYCTLVPSDSQHLVANQHLVYIDAFCCSSQCNGASQRPLWSSLPASIMDSELFDVSFCRCCRWR